MRSMRRWPVAAIAAFAVTSGILSGTSAASADAPGAPDGLVHTAVDVTVQNHTGGTLTLQTADFHHGHWSAQPANPIGAGGSVSGKAESTSNSGTDFTLHYTTADGSQITFEVSVPIVGTNSGSAASSSATYVANADVGGGYTSSTTFTVTEGQVSYGYSGAAQSYTVPDGVSQLQVVAQGGSGGGGNNGFSGESNGLAAVVHGTLDVSGGEQLTVGVGGLGGTTTEWLDGVAASEAAGGWGLDAAGGDCYCGGAAGSSGGGGATVVLDGSGDEAIVASGGGGGTYFGNGGAGGAGWAGSGATVSTHQGGSASGDSGGGGGGHAGGAAGTDQNPGQSGSSYTSAGVTGATIGLPTAMGDNKVPGSLSITPVWPVTSEVVEQRSAVSFFPGVDESSLYVTVPDGGPVTEPGTPQRDGWVFAGWFTAPAGGERWSFDTPVTEDVALYGVWTAASDASAGSSTETLTQLPATGGAAPVAATVIAALALLVGVASVLAARGRRARAGRPSA